jgi:uncharacterized protein (DUF1697 family)
MPKHIAFLRAINVGGHNVKMEVLRGLFEALGFTAVETFIASGNVIFDSPSTDTHALERQIEAVLQAGLGYEVATFIRSPAEVAAVAEHNPFTDAEGCTLYIAFLADVPNQDATEKLLGFNTEMDEFVVNGREAYWLNRTQMSDSPMSGARLEKTLGMKATVRNVTTVKKLAAKYG